jgi:hypothetical protein
MFPMSTQLQPAGGAMENEKSPKIKIQSQTCSGMVWIGGWLFTVGFLHLAFWRGVLAVVLWPYYLGLHFAH